MEQPYNPLDEGNLAETLVRALLQRECIPLSAVGEFEGAGIYALYYHGDFALYEDIAHANETGCHIPIYVGKASPRGSRKGLVALDTPPGKALSNRIREHAESIEAAKGLHIPHFTCRYLITSVLWLALGEGLLIKRYRPLWNTVVDGFGNHDPGGNRRRQSRRPEWDTLHPGRGWADSMQPCAKSLERIQLDVRAHLENDPIVRSYAEHRTGATHGFQLR